MNESRKNNIVRRMDHVGSTAPDENNFPLSMKDNTQGSDIEFVLGDHRWAETPDQPNTFVGLRLWKKIYSEEYRREYPDLLEPVFCDEEIANIADALNLSTCIRIVELADTFEDLIMPIRNRVVEQRGPESNYVLPVHRVLRMAADGKLKLPSPSSDLPRTAPTPDNGT